MNNELSKISDLITNIFKTDDFCQKINPPLLREAVQLYPLRAGKRLRPALVLWSCGMLGGDIEKALFAAASAEMYHNWTLVHDDIIDNDEVRRGLPSTHISLKNSLIKLRPNLKEKSDKFGVDFAILTGDLQHAWALSLLMKSQNTGVSPDVVLSLCSDMTNILSPELISGEAIDVEFSYRDFLGISSHEVENMQYLKTAALLNYCVTAGAKIALNTTDQSSRDILKLIDYSTSVGLAFQLMDDWLGIFGNFAEFGKPIGSDICESKPTLLILETLERVSDRDRDFIFSILGNDCISDNDLSKLREMVKTSGAENSILTKIKCLKRRADNSLSIFPQNRYKSLLLALNSYLTTRSK